MAGKPTVKRCALKTGHEGPHLWINTRRLGQFGECRAFSPSITEQLAAMAPNVITKPCTCPVDPEWGRERDYECPVHGANEDE